MAERVRMVGLVVLDLFWCKRQQLGWMAWMAFRCITRALASVRI